MVLNIHDLQHMGTFTAPSTRQNADWELDFPSGGWLIVRHCYAVAVEHLLHAGQGEGGREKMYGCESVKKTRAR